MRNEKASACWQSLFRVRWSLQPTMESPPQTKQNGQHLPARTSLQMDGHQAIVEEENLHHQVPTYPGRGHVFEPGVAPAEFNSEGSGKDTRSILGYWRDTFIDLLRPGRHSPVAVLGGLLCTGASVTQTRPRARFCGTVELTPTCQKREQFSSSSLPYASDEVVVGNQSTSDSSTRRMRSSFETRIYQMPWEDFAGGLGILSVRQASAVLDNSFNTMFRCGRDTRVPLFRDEVATRMRDSVCTNSFVIEHRLLITTDEQIMSHLVLGLDPILILQSTRDGYGHVLEDFTHIMPDPQHYGVTSEYGIGFSSPEVSGPSSKTGYSSFNPEFYLYNVVSKCKVSFKFYTELASHGTRLILCEGIYWLAHTMEFVIKGIPCWKTNFERIHFFRPSSFKGRVFSHKSFGLWYHLDVIRRFPGVLILHADQMFSFKPMLVSSVKSRFPEDFGLFITGKDLNVITNVCEGRPTVKFPLSVVLTESRQLYSSGNHSLNATLKSLDSTMTRVDSVLLLSLLRCQMDPDHLPTLRTNSWTHMISMDGNTNKTTLTMTDKTYPMVDSKACAHSAQVRLIAPQARARHTVDEFTVATAANAVQRVYFDGLRCNPLMVNEQSSLTLTQQDRARRDADLAASEFTVLGTDQDPEYSQSLGVKNELTANGKPFRYFVAGNAHVNYMADFVLHTKPALYAIPASFLGKEIGDTRTWMQYLGDLSAFSHGFLNKPPTLELTEREEFNLEKCNSIYTGISTRKCDTAGSKIERLAELANAFFCDTVTSGWKWGVVNTDISGMDASNLSSDLDKIIAVLEATHGPLQSEDNTLFDRMLPGDCFARVQSELLSTEKQGELLDYYRCLLTGLSQTGKGKRVANDNNEVIKIVLDLSHQTPSGCTGMTSELNTYSVIIMMFTLYSFVVNRYFDDMGRDQFVMDQHGNGFHLTRKYKEEIAAALTFTYMRACGDDCTALVPCEVSLDGVVSQNDTAKSALTCATLAHGKKVTFEYSSQEVDYQAQTLEIATMFLSNLLIYDQSREAHSIHDLSKLVRSLTYVTKSAAPYRSRVCAKIAAARLLMAAEPGTKTAAFLDLYLPILLDLAKETEEWKNDKSSERQDLRQLEWKWVNILGLDPSLILTLSDELQCDSANGLKKLAQMALVGGYRLTLSNEEPALRHFTNAGSDFEALVNLKDSKELEEYMTALSREEFESKNIWTLREPPTVGEVGLPHIPVMNAPDPSVETPPDDQELIDAILVPTVHTDHSLTTFTKVFRQLCDDYSTNIHAHLLSGPKTNGSKSERLLAAMKVRGIRVDFMPLKSELDVSTGNDFINERARIEVHYTPVAFAENFESAITPAETLLQFKRHVDFMVVWAVGRTLTKIFNSDAANAHLMNGLPVQYDIISCTGTDDGCNTTVTPYKPVMGSRINGKSSIQLQTNPALRLRLLGVELEAVPPKSGCSEGTRKGKGGSSKSHQKNKKPSGNGKGKKKPRG